MTNLISYFVSCRGCQWLCLPRCRRVGQRRLLLAPRPSRGLPQVLHLPGRRCSWIWLPHWYRFQDRRQRWHWQLRGSRGCSRLVSCIDSIRSSISSCVHCISTWFAFVCFGSADSCSVVIATLAPTTHQCPTTDHRPWKTDYRQLTTRVSISPSYTHSLSLTLTLTICLWSSTLHSQHAHTLLPYISIHISWPILTYISLPRPFTIAAKTTMVIWIWRASAKANF